MAHVIAFSLYTVGIMTLMLGVEMIFKYGRLGQEYRMYGYAALFSSLWSISFSFLPVQESFDAARRCRAIGMLGVFFMLMTLMYLFLHCIDGAKWFKAAVMAFSSLGILIWPFIIGYKSVVFEMTDLGMSYHFVRNIPNTIYNIYCGLVALLYFVVLLYILRTTKRKKMRVIIMRAVVCCFVVIVGMIFDIALPIFGYSAVPASTFAQGVGIMIIYSALRFHKTSKLNAENFSEFVYYSVKTPVMIFDEKGRLGLGNTGASDFIGARFCNYRDNRIFIWECFHIGRDCLEYEGNQRVMEARCLLNNRFCQIEINKIHDEYLDVIGYVVVLNDLTEKQEFISKLQISELEAERANKAKSSFLARMSHEIRTPINGIIGMNELILGNTKQEDILKYANIVKHSANNLLDLINDILDISKIETDRLELEDAEYNLRDLIIDMGSVGRTRAQQKGIVLETIIKGEMPLRLYGDSKKVRQIAFNVIGNAIKYTRQGSVKITVDCYDEKENTYIRCSVKDTGIGIRSEDIEKIFNSFERVDIEKNKGIEGTGLGLSIVKSLLDFMDGAIDVKSEYGVGSEFIFSIPQKRVGEDTFSSIEDNDSYNNICDVDKITLSIPDKHILVVDDNDINRMVAEGILEYTGADIDSAESAKQCIEMVKKKKYDIMLLDHLMPEMDGIELLGELKRMEGNLSSEAVCIVLTANAIQGAKEEYLSYGFDDYLSKPIDILEVERVLRKYCM